MIWLDQRSVCLGDRIYSSMCSDFRSLNRDQQAMIQAIFRGYASDFAESAGPIILWASVLQLFKELNATVIRSENRIQVSIQNHVGVFIYSDQQVSLNRRQLFYLCDYLRVVGVDPFDV